MAATTTIIDRGSAGDLFFRVVDVLLDGSYPANGYAVAAKDLGFGTNGVIYAVVGSTDKTGLWSCGWDYTNGKLRVVDGSAAANLAMHEVAAATVLTGVVMRLLVFGKGQG